MRFLLLLIAICFSAEAGAPAQASRRAPRLPPLTPWPRACVDRFGIAPVTFNGALGREREFEQWSASLDEECAAAWEQGLAEIRARDQMKR